MDVQIRWMIRRDMAEILEIEFWSFEYAWSEDDFMRCLRQRNCIGMVAVQDVQIVGYMIYELLSSRLNILNFAVHPDFRMLGVGRQMVEKLIAKLTLQRRKEITLTVRESNLPAQLFFQHHGFLAVDVLHDCYEDCDEDGYRMLYSLGDKSTDILGNSHQVDSLRAR